MQCSLLQSNYYSGSMTFIVYLGPLHPSLLIRRPTRWYLLQPFLISRSLAKSMADMLFDLDSDELLEP